MTWQGAAAQGRRERGPGTREGGAHPGGGGSARGAAGSAGEPIRPRLFPRPSRAAQVSRARAQRRGPQMQQQVTLVSSDGKRVELTRAAALASGLLKEMLEDEHHANVEVPMPK